MGKLLAVIKREYLERVRTKWFIITTVFGPVFFLGISVVPGLLTVRNMRSAQVTDFRILDATGIGAAGTGGSGTRAGIGAFLGTRSKSAA